MKTPIKKNGKKEAIELLTKIQVKNKLIRQKVGKEPVKVLIISIFIIIVIIGILISIINISEIFKFIISVSLFFVFAIIYSKNFDTWIDKYYYENNKYYPTEEELQQALSKEYKKLAKEKLQNALDKKEKIRKIEKEIKLSIEQADDCITLGIKEENIDVKKWCIKNQWNENESTRAKAYDEEIGSLRTQLW